MNDKEKYITELKLRTKKFAIEIIALCDNLKATKAASVVSYKIIKSATSVGANYRAACHGRSKAEFYSKICIVVEDLCKNNIEVNRWLKESNGITKILTKAKSTAYLNK